MPMEEALMAFAEIDISRMKNFTSEKEKGIPFISFVMKEKEGAVFTGPHPLFIADSLLREQKAEGREILYRADYIRSGTDKFATGVLSAGEKQETFLKLLKNNISSGNAKADVMGIYRYLETHLTLCGLERLGGGADVSHLNDRGRKRLRLWERKRQGRKITGKPTAPIIRKSFFMWRPAGDI